MSGKCGVGGGRAGHLLLLLHLALLDLRLLAAGHCDADGLEAAQVAALRDDVEDGAAALVLGGDVGLAEDEEADDFVEALLRGDVESGLAGDAILLVDVGAKADEVDDASDGLVLGGGFAGVINGVEAFGGEEVQVRPCRRRALA